MRPTFVETEGSGLASLLTDVRDEEPAREDPPLTEQGEPVEPGAVPGGAGGRQQVVTAFVVYQTMDGAWRTEVDPSVPLEVARPAGNYDLTAGCACVMRDVAARTATGDLINTQMIMAQQAATQREAEEILAATRRGPGPGANRAGRRHPGR